jgi:hypothetical protein
MTNITDKRFFTGGHAIFTVESNNQHRTYKVKVSKPNPRYPKPAYFVGLLSGPDNVNSYQYLGMLDENTGAVRLTGKSRMSEDSDAVRGVRWVMTKFFNNLPIPDAVNVRHCGRCGCCGRTLTEPVSLDRGIGPVCWRRLNGENVENLTD